VTVHQLPVPTPASVRRPVGPATASGVPDADGIIAAGNRDWIMDGLCIGRDPDELFVSGAAQRHAAQVCNGCPVRLECLADALDNRVEFGVWGGLTERQRRAVLRQRPDVTSWRELLEAARDGVGEEEAS
jgi:WhiB family transcriptional regulator, redox-sensing transcriptional regulator